MPKTTAHDVAHFILHFVHEVGDPISNLKLQKLVYYAQAWHLAIFDQPLFDDPIEAWVHGPVVHSLYTEFKDSAWRPIISESESVSLPRDVQDHVEEVLAQYGGLTALHLEQLTHQETPWIRARAGLPADAPCRNVISHDDMKQCYRALINAQR